MTITREELLKSLQSTYSECVEISRKKNADYADSDDAFKNFYASKMVGVTPPRAILVRITDKLTRIANLLEKEPEVVDEKINDTILDAINYLAILKAYIEQ